MKKNEILKSIYLYFPKNIKFGSKEYYSTIECKRFQKKVKQIKEINNPIHKFHFNNTFQHYNIIDFTDYEEKKCWEIHILLHKNQDLLDDDILLLKELNGVRYDLYIYISVLEKYYFYFINITEFSFINKSYLFKNIYNIPNGIRKELKLFRKSMKENGYSYILNSQVHSIVEGVETKYIEQGKVTIFNCIFTDMVTI